MSNSTISWKSDPDFRGTFNILSTCFSTLLICVWSAVHDDIAKGKQGYRAIFRKIGWLIIGLLAPELLLYVSFSQYITAGRILREADRAFGTSSPPSSRRSWWSIGRRKRTRSQVRTFSMSDQSERALMHWLSGPSRRPTRRAIRATAHLLWRCVPRQVPRHFSLERRMRA